MYRVVTFFVLAFCLHFFAIFLFILYCNLFLDHLQVECKLVIDPLTTYITRIGE